MNRRDFLQLSAAVAVSGIVGTVAHDKASARRERLEELIAYHNEWIQRASLYEIKGYDHWSQHIAKTTHDLTKRKSGTFAPHWLVMGGNTENRFSTCSMCGMVGVIKGDGQRVYHVVTRWISRERGREMGYEIHGECVMGSV